MKGAIRLLGRSNAPLDMAACISGVTALKAGTHLRLTPDSAARPAGAPGYSAQ